MFSRVDGKLVGSQDQTQLYWTEVPEFGFLQEHSLSGARGTGGREVSLRERMEGAVEGGKGGEGGEVGEGEAGREMLEMAFMRFVAGLLGFEVEKMNGEGILAVYGLDSLSGVSCQYWFHRGMSSFPPERADGRWAF